MDANELARKVAHGMLAAEGTGPAWGIVIEEARAGYARLSMVVRADMLNGHAICHGGYVFTLADSAFAFACNSYNLNTVASGCAIDFIAPARLGARFVQRALGHSAFQALEPWLQRQRGCGHLQLRRQPLARQGPGLF